MPAWLRRALNLKSLPIVRGTGPAVSYELPRASFSRVVRLALLSFERCFVIQPYAAKELCSSVCRNAADLVCSCSCLGVNHGVGGYRWYALGEVAGTAWRGRTVSIAELQRLWLPGSGPVQGPV
jgi:hypothetical protein